MSAAHPGFWHRFTETFDETGETIAGTSEHSRDGSAWEHDFDATSTRIRA